MFSILFKTERKKSLFFCEYDLSYICFKHIYILLNKRNFMNHGHGRGCRCHNERQSRWLEPSVLYLLWGEQKHGYELMSELPKLGFMTGAADPGAIYRTLRHLEDVGLVESEWDTSGSGPAKRVYSLSELGKAHLQLWADSLRQRRNALDDFLQKLDSVMKNNSWRRR
jgi:PadR family transcriptional regulator PadR